MKKILLTFLGLVFIILSVFFLSPTNIVKAEGMTLSQLIELLISINVIPAEKVTAARALANSQTAIVSTATTTQSRIQVLSPNTAVSWELDVDTAYSITWGSSGLTSVRIALVPTKGANCELTYLPVSSKDGDHTYNIYLKKAQCYNLATATSTALKDGSYKVRVYGTDAKGVLVKDDSDVSFKILPVPIPSIKVTYPNGGEKLLRNEEYDVKYTLKNVTNVEDNMIYLYLIDNYGNNAYNSHKIKNKAGTYSLDFPSGLSEGFYKVKLKTTTTDDVEIEDMSDNYFWVSTGY